MQPLMEESLETPGGGAGGLGPKQGSNVLTADTMLVDEESESEAGLMPLSPSDSVKRYSIPQPGEGGWNLEARHYGRYTKRKSSVKGELCAVLRAKEQFHLVSTLSGPGVDVNAVRVIAEVAEPPSAVVMETSFIGTAEESQHVPAPQLGHLHIDEFDVGPPQCWAVAGSLSCASCAPAILCRSLGLQVCTV